MNDRTSFSKSGKTHELKTFGGFNSLFEGVVNSVHIEIVNAQARPRLENSLTNRTLNLESLNVVCLNVLLDIALFLARFSTLCALPD